MPTDISLPIPYENRRLIYLVTEDWYFCSHRLELAKAAKAAGWDVHVITQEHQHGAQIRAAGIILHPFHWQRGNINPLNLIHIVWQLKVLLQSLNPCLIHNISLKTIVLGSVAAWLGGVHIVVNSLTGLGATFTHNMPLQKFMRFCANIILRTVFGLIQRQGKVALIVQNSENLAVFTKMGLVHSKAHLIQGSGVDTNLLQPLPMPVLLVTNENRKIMRFGYVGRMVKSKGLEVLIPAFALARAELLMHGIEAELWLVGKPDPYNPMPLTNADLRNWDLQAGVTWLGQLDDIEAVWRHCHIAVLPSLGGEGLPKSLLESGALGRPMITTDVAGCRALMRDEGAEAGNALQKPLLVQAGMLIPPNDKATLQQAMVQMAQMPLSDLTAMGMAARQRIEANFGLDAIIAQTLSVYTDVTCL